MSLDIAADEVEFLTPKPQSEYAQPEPPSNGFADLLLPRPRAHYATACQAPTAEFQTTR